MPPPPKAQEKAIIEKYEKAIIEVTEKLDAILIHANKPRIWDIEDLFTGAIFGSWVGSVPSFWNSVYSVGSLIAIVLSAVYFLRLVATDDTKKVAILSSLIVLLIWTLATVSLLYRKALTVPQVIFLAFMCCVFILSAFLKRRRV
jgi:hypothetical protein